MEVVLQLSSLEGAMVPAIVEESLKKLVFFLFYFKTLGFQLELFRDLVGVPKASSALSFLEGTLPWI